MGSACPEWTVASSDQLFIGMQNNGQWSVMWGVVGTDLVVEVITVTTVCLTMKVGQKTPSSCDLYGTGKFFFDMYFIRS